MMMKNKDNYRKVPKIPPQGEKIRVIIDTDCKAEIDDQWAISLAMLSPERFEIEGFVGANFDNQHTVKTGRDPKALGEKYSGPGSIEASVKEVKKVMKKAGLEGRWPVKHGAPPMRYQFEPSFSEGVEFIIEQAMKSSREDPLWIIGLGAATDMASAFLTEPEIVDRVVVFWHFRTMWPEHCYNFNVFNDPRAARVIFHAPLPFVLFDTGTHLTIPMEESEKTIQPYGELGEYLHTYREISSSFMSSSKGFFDLGDIAALIEPDIASWEEVDCPEVDWGLNYHFRGSLGRILRCYDVNRDRAFTLLHERLKMSFG